MGSYSAECQFFVGAPGSGKSYSSVVRSVAFHLLRRRPLITNLEINKRKFGDFCREMSKPEWKDFDYEGLIKMVDIRLGYQRPVKVVRVEVGQDVDSFDMEVNEYNEGALITHERFWEWCPEDSMLVIDEPHSYWPQETQSEYNKKHPEMFIWLSQHRHYGVEVLFLTQRWGRVNKALRDAASVIYTFHNLNKVKASFLKLVMPQRFMWSMHFTDITSKALDSGSYKPNPRIFELYKSKSKRIGLQGNRRPLDDIKSESEAETAAVEPPKTWAGAIWVWAKSQPAKAVGVVGFVGFLVWLFFSSTGAVQGQWKEAQGTNSVKPSAAAKPSTVAAVAGSSGSLTNGVDDVPKLTGRVGESAVFGSAIIDRGGVVGSWTFSSWVGQRALFVGAGGEVKAVALGGSL